MRPTRVGIPLALCAAAWSADAPSIPQGADVPPAPAHFQFDGQTGEWRDRPSTFTLRPPDARSPDGRMWLGTADTGLVIAGHIPGQAPRWPATVGEMAAGDHLEVWLADGDTLVLPPVGWGNQFRDAMLASIDDCASPSLAENADTGFVATCRTWFAGQERYRRTFRRLFVRQWQLAPEAAGETFATPAFDAFDEALRQQLAPLRPAGVPTMRAATNPAESGYEFEIVVPWSGFPPLRSLDVTRLRVMVDVFRPGAGGRRYGSFSSTAAGRRWGDVRTFNLTRLTAPRRYTVSVCGYPLQAYRARTAHYFGYSHVRVPDTLPSYFLPTQSRDVTTVLGLENEARGYAYTPEGHSPIVTPTTYFARPLGDGAVLCGPPLRYTGRSGTMIVDSLTLDRAVEVRALPAGSYLLRNGPRAMTSFYGSGQCGGCPRFGFTMLRLDPGEAVGSILEIFEVADPGLSDVDMAVSAGWDSVHVFRSATTDYETFTWRETTYCLDGSARAYAVCAERDSVPEPNPRHVVYDNH
jgi:hypothetical protein